MWYLALGYTAPSCACSEENMKSNSKDTGVDPGEAELGRLLADLQEKKDNR